jgi:hypothetical protein
MTISEPRLRSLLRQARKVADSGKRTAAVQLYSQIVEEAPDSAEAWLGLAAVLSDEAEQRSAYEHVLKLAPQNQEAQTGLTRLQGAAAGTPEPSATDKLSLDDPFEQSRRWLNDATSPPGRSMPAAPEKDSTPPGPASRGISNESLENQELTVAEFADLACYRHPNRETSLRCYSCDRPICSECAVKTPVGYRCPTCIREAEDAFYNVQPFDYIVAPLVSLPLSLVAGYLILRFGGGGFLFIFLMLFIGGAIGGLIGRVTKRAVGRRRGRYLPYIVAVSVVLGVALPLLFLLFLGATVSIGALLIPGIYLFVATSAAFYQMK